MRNPFARPETTPQWLLGSGCWTTGCLGVWLGGSYVLTRFPDKAELNIFYFPLGFCLANPLIARYALLNGWRFVSHLETTGLSWQKVLASCWFALLASFQLCCLAAFFFLCYLLFF